MNTRASALLPIVGAALWILSITLSVTAGEARPAFIAEGTEFRFDTGALRGTLRAKGRSAGLGPVFDCRTGTNLTSSMGLFSHYRLLDRENRYGTGAWDWASAATLLPDGAVEARWTADAAHPFDLAAVYRWASSNALDVTTRVTARKDLRRFESFLASYFAGFADARVYAQGSPAAFVPADQTSGVWQMFPRDAAAVDWIRDGRWTRPPNPVEWAIRPCFAGALGIRRDAASGWTALVMARPSDCFAVATPHSAEGHRSLYLSLFGRDLKAGESISAPARLVLARDLSESAAIALYEEWIRSSDAHR